VIIFITAFTTAGNKSSLCIPEHSPRLGSPALSPHRGAKKAPVPLSSQLCFWVAFWSAEIELHSIYSSGALGFVFVCLFVFKPFASLKSQKNPIIRLDGALGSLV